jgi:cytochrome b561
MRDGWANIALLAVLVVDLASGLAGLSHGDPELRWLLWLHAVGGYAILLLARWKGGIVARAWRRPRPMVTAVARRAFVLLAALVIATVLTGTIWTFVGRWVVAGYSLMTIHVALGGAIVPLIVWHVVTERRLFRVKSAVGRRAFLRLGAVTLGGAALWQSSALVSGLLALPGSIRRFTGSYEIGSLTGAFPTVIWLGDGVPAVKPADWRLVVEGAVARPLSLSYEDVLKLGGRSATVTIDCTGGWYSTQVWQGVALSHVLDLAALTADARSVTVESLTGYARRFSLTDARSFLLATHVADAPLDTAHGAPVRLVAPEYRGFDWVKWVTRVRVESGSELLQPPLPLQ